MTKVAKIAKIASIFVISPWHLWGAAGARRIEAIAVAGSAPTPTPPCGACRQFLYEFNPEMTVVSEGANGEWKQWRLSALLLDGFGPTDMEGAR